MKKKWTKFLLVNSLMAIVPLSVACSTSNKNSTNNTEVNSKPEDKNQESGSNTNNSDIQDIINKGGTVVDDSANLPNMRPNGNQENNYARIPGKPDNADTPEYKNANTEQKYYFDAEAYSKALKEHLESNGYDLKIPSDINVQEYNKKAKEQLQPTFTDAYYQNFSYYNGNGLVVNPIGNSTRSGHWNSTPGNRGKARYLPNSLYKDAALQTYSIVFNNQRKKVGSDNEYLNHYGTAWILDYKLEDGQKYPLKWYIATNVHVAEALIKSQDDQSVYQNIKDGDKQARELKEVSDQRQKWEKAYLDKVEGFAQEAKTKWINSSETQATYKEKEKTNKQVADEWLKNESQKIYDQTKGIPRRDINEFKEWAKYKIQEDKLLEANKGITSSISLVHLNDNAKLHTELTINEQNRYFDSFVFKPEQMKIVYAGTNFLNTHPKDYLDSNSPYKDYEEMADFAVIEVDFSKLNQYTAFTSEGKAQEVKEIVERDVSRPITPEDIAQIATSNYANSKDKQIKFATKSIYQDYKNLENTILPKEKFTKDSQELLGDNEKIRSKLNWDFLAVGYPLATTDNQLSREDQYKYRYQIEYNASLWTNKPNRDNFPSELGNGLTNAVTFRSFAGKKGISDILIVNPMIKPEKKQGFVVDGIKEKDAEYKGDHYLLYGLGYSLASWEPLGGSSGSSVRDIDNNVYGINFFAGTSEGFSNVSLIAAFRSEGIDYHGFYGKYNLEQYDLIYGGGKKQRTSYRQALQKLYGDNYKTNLFQKGTNIIPEEYKFKN